MQLAMPANGCLRFYFHSPLIFNKLNQYYSKQILIETQLKVQHSKLSFEWCLLKYTCLKAANCISIKLNRTLIIAKFQ